MRGSRRRSETACHAARKARPGAPLLFLALGLGGCAGEGRLGPYFDDLKPGAGPVRGASYASAAMRGVSYTPQGEHDTAIIGQSVFNRINLHRTTRGLTPLRHHAQLAETAGQHARRMAAGSPMSHDGMRGRLGPFLGGLFGYRGGGEILASTSPTGDPAGAAMVTWLASYRHRDVIEEDYSRIGIGVARRSGGGYYFSVLFLR